MSCHSRRTPRRTARIVHVVPTGARLEQLQLLPLVLPCRVAMMGGRAGGRPYLVQFVCGRLSSVVPTPPCLMFSFTMAPPPTIIAPPDSLMSDEGEHRTTAQPFKVMYTRTTDPDVLISLYPEHQCYVCSHTLCKLSQSGRLVTRQTGLYRLQSRTSGFRGVVVVHSMSCFPPTQSRGLSTFSTRHAEAVRPAHPAASCAALHSRLRPHSTAGCASWS